MSRIIATFSLMIFLISCSTNRNVGSANEIPLCLVEKIKEMTKDPTQGEPLEVRSYSYKQKTVYYIMSACCDKYNIVLDKNCDVLGYPDGGYTGKGDGTMTDFRDKATDEKVVWTKK